MQTTRLCSSRPVLDDDHVLTLPAGVTQFGDGGGGIREQPLLVGRVYPGPRHDPRAVARPDLVLERVNERVERGGIDQALFDEQRLERLDAERQV